ncbi:hypothetical protein K439DRAFT_1373013 [Ramaria rubella]|nr:hypothetical protein K439DRAFT_1373013 [Ramaria rubella]
MCQQPNSETGISTFLHIGATAKNKSRTIRRTRGGSHSYRTREKIIQNPSTTYTNEENTKTVKRIQLPLMAAYAFMDYRLQGQTIPHVIVDIGTPPSGGKLSMFNLYVALSRSSGQETVWLLRDFNKNIFMQELGIHLELEDQRLRELNEKNERMVGINV